MMNPDEFTLGPGSWRLAVGRGGSKVATERPFSRIYCPYVSSSLSLLLPFRLPLSLDDAAAAAAVAAAAAALPAPACLSSLRAE